MLTVTVEGDELLAFGSSNPCAEEQYHTGSFTTYYDRALAIVRADEGGELTILMTDGIIKTKASTGVASGIGRAFADIFARDGYDMVIIGRNLEKMNAMKAKYERRYHNTVTTV